MMDVANLVIGFLGALLGVAGTVFVYFRDRQQHALMAGRAVFFEVATNQASLELLLESGLGITTTEVDVPLPIGDSLFKGNLAVLCGFLTAEEVRMVARPYAFVPECEHIRHNVVVANKPVTLEERRRLEGTRNHFVEAKNLLHLRSYGKPLPAS
jgi:hypothetical protein